MGREDGRRRPVDASGRESQRLRTAQKVTYREVSDAGDFIEYCALAVLGPEASKAARFVQHVNRRSGKRTTGTDAITSKFGVGFVYFQRFTGLDRQDPVTQAQLKFITTKIYLSFMDEAIAREEPDEVAIRDRRVVFARRSLAHQRRGMDDIVHVFFAQSLTQQQREEAEVWYNFFTLTERQREPLIRRMKGMDPEAAKAYLWERLSHPQFSPPQIQEPRRTLPRAVTVEGGLEQIDDRAALLQELHRLRRTGRTKRW